MIQKLIKWWLRQTNRQYLVNFWEGVTRIGKPSDISFPKELLEQGLGILLSGLNNTLAIHSHLNWIWPFWVERQLSPEYSDFIPTGVNTVTLNLTHRNWVSIGYPDCAEEGMVDPVGMITPAPFSWSILPYFQINDTFFHPSKSSTKISQKTISNGEVQTTYNLTNTVTARSLINVEKASNTHVIVFKLEISNISNQAIDLQTGISIRPYNCLSIARIESIKFKNNSFYVNGKKSIILDQDPEEVSISSSGKKDIFSQLNSSEMLKKNKSHTGMLSAISNYSISLKSNQTKRLTFYIALGDKTLENFTKEDLNIKQLPQKEACLELNCSDKKLMESYKTVRNRLHIFDDISHYTPGTYFYHQHWIRDSYFISRAFIESGKQKNLKQKVYSLIKLQTVKGFFKSQNGEWDSNGQAICIITETCRVLNDKELMIEIYPYLLKAVEWIDSMRSKSESEKYFHKGLLPAGFSAEHFGPNDHYLWDNFWSVKGIKEVINVAKLLGKDEDKSYLSQLFDTYDSDLRLIIEIMSIKSKQLASSPYREPDSASVGNLIAITPLHLFPKQTYWFKSTVDFLYDNFIVHGLFYQKIFHTGLNPYLSVQLAKSLLVLGDLRYKKILERLVEFGGQTLTWPEAINPKTLGGCMGDGDHGWAASEFVSLIRFLFVFEQEKSLYLGAGILDEWYRSKEPIYVKNAYTTYGVLNYSIDFEKEEIIFHWSITKNDLQEKASLILIIPKSIEYEITPKSNYSDNHYKIRLDGLQGSLKFQSKRSMKKVNNE